MDNNTETVRPHALMFPYPSRSHINPMLQLAKLLLHEGFFITFVNTEFNHRHIFQHNDSQMLRRLPNLRFEQIADGLPLSHLRLNDKDGPAEFVAAILALPGPFLKLVRRITSSGDDHPFPPLTCIIADSFSSWMQDIANQFRIPRIALWTTPVHANLGFTLHSTLASQGLTPVTDKSKLAEEFNIEGIVTMKLEDYISFFLVDTPTGMLYQYFSRFSMKRLDEALWNLGNNVEEFESEAVTAFKKEVPNFLPIGPLLPPDMLSPTQLATPADALMPQDALASLWPHDPTCIAWLSQHNPASVIYISFGSIVNMPEEELAEFILGLEESMSPFLWAVRPDQPGVALSQLRERLDAEAARDKRSRRGLMVSWAPQLAVLRHPSVGLFLTHCGWNSIMESLVAGVPILAKAGGFAEQGMNAHYVAEVWKVGLRLPSRVTAAVVKAHICTLLGSSPTASNVRERVQQLQQCATAAAVGSGSSRGSSQCNLRLFIDDMYKRASAQCHNVCQLQQQLGR